MEDCKLPRLLLFLFIGCVLSCVKDPQDIPSGLSTDPVFGMEATFGNEPVMIDAGVNGWTMLPVAEQKDSSIIYTAVFSKNGCLNECSPSWTFTFYQASGSSNDPLQEFNSTFQTGDKEFVLSAQEKDSFQITLSTHPGLFMSGYSSWEDLNGDNISYLHDFERVVGYQENINVCFQSLAYTGCQYNQCIYFDPATKVPCLSSIEPRLESPSYVSLNIRPEGTPPFDIRWFNESTASSIIIPIAQDSSAEIYAGVTVTDSLGNRSELFQTIRIKNGDVDACYFPIHMASIPLVNSTGAINTNRVEITYRDENGVVWTSSEGIQPDESSFSIFDYDSYEVSPSNQQAYIAELQTRAVLFDPVTGASRLFATDKLTLALSHP